MPAPGADPADLLETLFRHSALETTVPVDFSLRELIASRLEHRRDDDELRARLLDLSSRYGDARRTTLQ